ncbi:MAG TPA: cobalamin-binding protein [Dehalococcoidia bacterium]|nr:cobalamin-binding protein [Dehalococcoidia bacterium]
MSGTLKHIMAWPLLLAILGSSLVACGPAEEAKDFPLEITDQLDRTVRLEKIPERIISLASSNTEILFALGLGDRVVGVTKYCDFPPEARQKEQIGGFSTPDIEKVVSLSPDLIVAASIHQKKIIPELERRNLPVIALAPKTLSDVLEAITLMGRISGRVDEAKRLVEDMQGRIDRVTSLTEGLSSQDRPRVFYISWHDPLRTVGGDKLHNELIRVAGGENIFGDVTGYPTVDLEIVLERDPQVIVASSGHGSAGRSPFQWAISEPRLKGTEALKLGRVYEVDADIVSRPGPRIVQGLEAMLQFIHPELHKKL